MIESCRLEPLNGELNEMLRILLVLALGLGNTPALAQVAGQGPARVNHRGHRWVRSHPFTLMGLVRMHPQPFDMAQYRGAEFNALLAWEPGSFDKLVPLAAADGMPYHIHLEKKGEATAARKDSTEQSLREGIEGIDSEENRAALAKWARHSSCIGFMVNDEISNPKHLRYTRHYLKWLRAQYPEALAYSNAHPAGHEGDLGMARWSDTSMSLRP